MVKVLGVHPVQHVHSRVAVLRGGDEDEVLAVRRLGVAHKHTLVALFGLCGLKLGFLHKYATIRDAGHFHPVGFLRRAGEHLAAHQVVRHEGVLLLEGDVPVVALLPHRLYLAVGRADANLSAHAAHLVYQQFKDIHHAPHSYLVNYQVRQHVLVKADLPAVACHATAAIVGAAQQFAHHKGEQFGIALAIDAPVLLLPEHHALLKGYPSLRAVVAFLADKLLLAPSCREQVVVSRLRIVPRAYDVGQGHALCPGLGIVLQLSDAVVHLVKRACLQGVADFQVHLAWQVHLARYLGDTALPVAVFREILVAYKPDTPADMEHGFVLLHPHMVGRGLIDADVLPVLGIVLLHGIQELLLRYRVVLVGHTHVPKDIVVPYFGHELSTRQLGVIVIRPDGDYLELTRLAVEVHLEIVVIIGTESGKLAVLERDALGLTGQLVFVGIEVQRVVPEVVDGERVAVIVLDILAAHTAHLTGASWIDTAERVLLVVVIDAVLISVQFHILTTAGQHQTAVAVFLRVDVAGAAYREQARVELVGVAGVTLQARQSVAVAQRYLLSVLTLTDVHGLAFHPPLRAAAHFLGYLLQRLVAILALVVDDNEVGAVHLPHLPVGGVPHAVIDAFHHHRHMFPRSGGEREHWLGIVVGGLQHEETLYQALDAVKLHVIRPLAIALLGRGVFLGEPVALALKIHIVVHIEGYMLVMGERERQHVVALNLLLLGAAVTGRDVRPGGAVFVVYRQNHIGMLLECH